MTGAEADEVLGIVKRIGPVILSSAMELADDAGTALRRVIGAMVADRNMVHPATFGFALMVSLDLARHCMATLPSLDRVRKAALAEKPVSLPAVQAVLTIVRMALATEARIIGAMSFTSRDEVDAVSVAVNIVFPQTIDVAADDLDAGTYMLLTRLYGDVTRHLVEQGRLKPRVIPYAFQTAMPALRMAQQVYADPTRYLDLISENSVVHPAFMPREGRMLAV